MDDENVLNFVGITSCDPDKAAQYLRLTDGNLEQAIQLFFDSPNLDFGPATTSQPPASNAASSAQDPINLDSDEDMSDFNPPPHASTPPVRPPPDTEDDEAMARRLQEEMYGGGGAGGAGPEDVRAPMQRTTETLVGPDANWGPADADDDLDAMVQDQLARRRAGTPLCPPTRFELN
jgi:hypothetical protein